MSRSVKIVKWAVKYKTQFIINCMPKRYLPEGAFGGMETPEGVGFI
jgi:hypothetical protein